MRYAIPPISDVQAALARLTPAQLRALAEASGVPFTTLWKVRDKTTENPGIETVRKFLPHLKRAAKAVEAKVAGAMQHGDRQTRHREPKQASRGGR